jgi:hypothetical protein
MDPKKVTNVGVEHPVHLLPHDPDPERVQRTVLTAPRSEPIREPHEVLLVDLVQDRDHGVLNDFVLHGSNAQRALSSVGLGNVGSLGRLRTTRPAMHAAVKIQHTCLEVRLVVLPRDGIHTGRSIPLERVEAVPEQRDRDVVEQRGEPCPLVLTCNFPHTEQAAQRAGPALCPGRGRLLDVLLGRSPSLRALR